MAGSRCRSQAPGNRVDHLVHAHLDDSSGGTGFLPARRSSTYCRVFFLVEQVR
jgi:hypothetical protein